MRRAIAVMASVLVLAMPGTWGALGQDDSQDSDTIEPMCVQVLRDHARDRWDAASLTGAITTGTATIVAVTPPDTCGAVSPVQLGPPSEAVEAWRASTTSVFAEPSEWQHILLGDYFDMDRKQLRGLRREIRAQLASLRDVGSYPCYAHLHDGLVRSAESLELGIDSMLKGRDTQASMEIEYAAGDIHAFWDVRDAVDCGSEGAAAP
jgi:hypothetical protein